METRDFRIVQARQFLAEARQRGPADLPREALVREATELRRFLAWAIDVVDDFADSEVDEDVSQVTLWGGLYVAPADVRLLCDACLGRLAPEHPGAARPDSKTPSAAEGAPVSRTPRAVA